MPHKTNKQDQELLEIKQIMLELERSGGTKFYMDFLIEVAKALESRDILDCHFRSEKVVICTYVLENTRYLESISELLLRDALIKYSERYGGQQQLIVTPRSIVLILMRLE